MNLDIDAVLKGHYRVLGKLGQGGFGAAYLVQDEMGRQCVAKAAIRHDTVDRARFEWEAHILATLDHPNLPEVYGYFIENDQPYLVMEYIEGSDLQTLAGGYDKPFEVDQVLHWADGLLAALNYLHNQDPPIIHCDIKPLNVCITPEGEAILLDFGIACRLGGSPVSREGRFLTPHYAPIEQYPIERVGKYPVAQDYLRSLEEAGIHVGPYSDIYSLGATLYFALTLQHPPQALWRVMNKETLSLSELNPAVPDCVVRALEQALVVDPRERCQTATEFGQLLHPSKATKPGKHAQRWLVAGIALLLLITLTGLFLFGARHGWGPFSSILPTMMPSPTSMLALAPTPQPSSAPSPAPTATPPPTATPIPHATVKDERLDVYIGPGETYDILGQVQRGANLLILGRSGDGKWLQVSYLGWQGWAAAESVIASVDIPALPIVPTPPPPTNHPPHIENVTVASMMVEAQSIITVSCQASDPDKDRLTYTWTASGGSVIGEGGYVVYYAPQTLGSQTIHVAVRDRREEKDQQNIQVQIIPVVAPENTFEPAGIFGQLWYARPEMRHKLGGATGEDGTTDGAQQFFERGQMLWRKDARKIYVLAQSGTWQEFPDTWEEGKNICSCPEAAQQTPAPVRGFGKVWCLQLGGSNAKIGWATTDEQPYNVHWQAFDHGLMGQGLDGSLAGYIYVLYGDDDSWQLYPPPTSEGLSSCPYAPQQRVQVADRARVCTGHERLGLHAQPQQHSPEVTSLESGTLFTVIDGPVCANGWSWWKIHTDSGTVGWVAEGGNDIGPYSICPRR